MNALCGFVLMLPDVGRVLCQHSKDFFKISIEYGVYAFIYHSNALANVTRRLIG